MHLDPVAAARKDEDLRRRLIAKHLFDSFRFEVEMSIEDMPSDLARTTTQDMLRSAFDLAVSSSGPMEAFCRFHGAGWGVMGSTYGAFEELYARVDRDLTAIVADRCRAIGYRGPLKEPVLVTCRVSGEHARFGVGVPDPDLIPEGKFVLVYLDDDTGGLEIDGNGRILTSEVPWHHIAEVHHGERMPHLDLERLRRETAGPRENRRKRERAEAANGDAVLDLPTLPAPASDPVIDRENTPTCAVSRLEGLLARIRYATASGDDEAARRLVEEAREGIDELAAGFGEASAPGPR